ncbi:MAG: trigger factor [Acidobacteria bacterium]|nr:MAG: trigger factor [Acidobacteriota bacterium]
METKITQKSPALVQVEIQTGWDTVEQHYKKAVKEIASMVSIPGFRKGKAPAALIVKRYKQEITSSVARESIPQLVADAVKENHIQAVGEPQILNFSLKAKDSFSFEFMQEVKPEFELKEWKGMEVESLNIHITDEQVDENLDSLIDSLTETLEIKDRPAEEGETVEFKMTVMLEENKDTLFDEHLTLVLDERFPYPSVKEAIMSNNAGEDVELVIDADEDFEIEAARGQKVKVFLELMHVTKEVQPELNDEWAKTQEAESVADLKNKTREKLEKSAKQMETERVNMELLNRISDTYDFELPYSIVFETIQQMASNQLGHVISYIEDEKRKKALIDNFFRTHAAEAEKLVRNQLILEKIADEEKLEVTNEEVKAKVSEVMDLFPQEQKGMIDPENLDEELAERIRVDLLMQKTKGLIYDASKITWVDELTKPEAEHPEEDEEKKPEEDVDSKEVEEASATKSSEQEKDEETENTEEA